METVIASEHALWWSHHGHSGLTGLGVFALVVIVCLFLGKQR